MKLLILCLIIIFIMGACCKGCSSYTTATGERTGALIKLAKEGLFFKTQEAEMIKGGMNGGSGSFGVKPFFFTIRNNALLPAAQKAFNDGKEITITYHKELFCPFDSEASNGSGDNCYYLDSIK